MSNLMVKLTGTLLFIIYLINEKSLAGDLLGQAATSEIGVLAQQPHLSFDNYSPAVENKHHGLNSEQGVGEPHEGPPIFRHCSTEHGSTCHKVDPVTGAISSSATHHERSVVSHRDDPNSRYSFKSSSFSSSSGSVQSSHKGNYDSLTHSPSSQDDALDESAPQHSPIPSMDQPESRGTKRFQFTSDPSWPVVESVDKIYTDHSDPKNPTRIHFKKRMKSRVDPDGVSHESEHHEITNSLNSKGKTFRKSSSFSSSSSSRKESGGGMSRGSSGSNGDKFSFFLKPGHRGEHFPSPLSTRPRIPPLPFMPPVPSSHPNGGGGSMASSWSNVVARTMSLSYLSPDGYSRLLSNRGKFSRRARMKKRRIIRGNRRYSYLNNE